MDYYYKKRKLTVSGAHAFCAVAPVARRVVKRKKTISVCLNPLSLSGSLTTVQNSRKVMAGNQKHDKVNHANLAL
jgi:hypothetical protein